MDGADCHLHWYGSRFPECIAVCERSCVPSSLTGTQCLGRSTTAKRALADIGATIDSKILY